MLLYTLVLATLSVCVRVSGRVTVRGGARRRRRGVSDWRGGRQVRAGEGGVGQAVVVVLGVRRVCQNDDQRQGAAAVPAPIEQCQRGEGRRQD